MDHPTHIDAHFLYKFKAAVIKHLSCQYLTISEVVFENNNREETGSKGPENENIIKEFDNFGDGSSAPGVIESALDEAVSFYPDEECHKKRRRKPQGSLTKQTWTTEEEEEIKRLFKSFFETKTRPKPVHCIKAINKSKLANCHIWKRKKRMC